ncbi:MAG: hypothetical protein Q9201_005996 [Fulgogasparrea decipioides]
MGLSLLLLFYTTLMSCITAIPTIDSSTSVSTDTKQAASDVPTIADILNLSSDVLAIQLVGAQVNSYAFLTLCPYFDFTRLQASGYNVTAIRSIFCQASDVFFAKDLPSLDEVRDLTVDYSSYIWIFQAVGALKNDKNRIQKLCDLIDVPSASAIGQNGDLVKKTICSVGNGGQLPTVPLPQFK